MMMSGDSSLVRIPGCKAYHLLGDEQLHLASNAELALVLLPLDSGSASGSGSNNDAGPQQQQLTLTIGETLAFPLDEKTMMGTQQGNGQVYLLRPHLAGVTGPQGWIKIEMPAEVERSGSELSAARDQWESILVRYGHLFDSKIRAGADELSQGVLREGSMDVEAGIKDTLRSSSSLSRSHNDDNEPMHFSRSTHARAAQASSVTGTAAEYAKGAASAIGGLSATIGASIAKTFGVGQKAEEEKSDVRRTLEETARAFEDVGRSASEGTGRVAGAAASELQESITRSQGPEAGDLAGHAGRTLSNVGQVAGAGLVGTSAAYHGAELARGAVQTDIHPSAQ